MRRLTAAVLFSLAALPASAGDPPAKSAWDTLRSPAQDYFNAPDAAARKAALEKMTAAGLADAKLTKSQAEAAEKMALAGNTKAKGKGAQSMIDVEASDGKHPVFIHLAPGARPSSPSPLIIALHGGGSTTDYESAKTTATEMMSWFAKYADASGAITIFPGSTNWDTSGMEAMWKAVEYVQENFNIDPNHVMVYGGSMGGFGTGTAVSQKPTFFAMAAPFLGCVDLSSRAADFKNLPFYVVIGELDMEMCNKPAKATVKALKDAGCEVTFKELSGKGHEVPPKEFPEFIARFARAKRDMFAKKLGRAAGAGRWYWLDASGPLEAEISGQTITIKGPTSATVYLSDRMMDLDQPVKIVLNGDTKFEGKVERSLSILMGEIDATGDRGRTYVAKAEAK
ncbi:MAG: prolyl oligopeptidase family serine peptidase [Planctomycetes bacterium]|nr:prolyl oligopeptidase family serine peptidase [Planctomycetota bacterium]